MQGKRTRARDSRGRPVRGLYVRDGIFSADVTGPDGKRHRVNLTAATLTEARRERESLVAGMREGRVAARSPETFHAMFEEWQASRPHLAERTRRHERSILNRYLDALGARRVQDVSAGEVARIVRDIRAGYSEWTAVHVLRVLRGTFGIAVRRGVLQRSPVDGLAPSERPKQVNARRIVRLDAADVERVVSAGSSERWRCAFALAGFAGLRVGEIRGLRWSDVDLVAGTVTVARSLDPEGRPQPPKTQAGYRTVPVLPALRRRLIEWQLRSPYTRTDDYVIAADSRRPTAEQNLRRAFDAARKASKLAVADDERLSLHSLRHSYASMLATDLELPATTLAQLTGHADAGFTLKAYARDARPAETVVADVLKRAASAGVGR